MPFDAYELELLMVEICSLRDPLINAAAFVAGTVGAKRATAALDTFASSRPTSRVAREKMWELSRLLLLEEVYPDAQTRAIEPWDPRAEDVMFLADQLRDLLNALEDAVAVQRAL